MRRTAHRDRFDRQQPRTTVAAGTEPRPARRRLYVPVTAKFITAQMLVAGWLGVSLWLSLPWVRELAAATLTVPAIVVVSLVAQGAFSLYRTQALRAAGGWSDAIGEDIVLPWKLMRQGPGSTTSPPRSPLPPPRPGWFTWRASGPAGLGA